MSPSLTLSSPTGRKSVLILSSAAFVIAVSSAAFALPANAPSPATKADMNDVASSKLYPVQFQKILGDGEAITGQVRNATFNRATVSEALETLLKGTNISVTVVGGAGRYGTISANGVKGDVHALIDDLAAQMGFFYTVSNRNLIVSPEQNFALSPTGFMNESDLAELIDECQRLGARFVRKDSTTNMVVLAVSKKASIRIADFLSGQSARAESSRADAISFQQMAQKPVVPTAASMEPITAQASATAQQPWIVQNGSYLREVVRSFASRAGWVEVWNYKDSQTLEDKDIVIGGGMRVEGDFKEAITALFNALPASAKLKVELWPDNFPPTVYITREGAGQ